MKQIIVNHEALQTRIALIEDNKISEYYLETDDKDRIVGSIYKGTITNLEPSLQAAFVNIGRDKNAFLHYWDMIPATKDALEREESSGSKRLEREDVSELEDVIADVKPETNQENGKSSGWSAFLSPLLKIVAPKKTEPTPKPAARRQRTQHQQPRRKRTPSRNVDLQDIPKRFKANTDVIIQVSKGPIGTKGPRVTTNLSIPGRYVVLLPNSGHVGVSKRIEDRKERQRLREIIRSIKMPRGMGLICRTASIGVNENALRIDIAFLLEKWKTAQEKTKTIAAPVCIYEEPNLLEQTIRDSLSGDVDEIIVDSKDAFDVTQSYVEKLDQKDRTKVRYYKNPRPVFQQFGLTRQIEQIFNRSVTLRSGAELCFDETEALIAIDINSKKSRKGKDHPETILNTNLEAAEEIGRQLRLRNVGGLVIIDFIDMRSGKDRMTVYKKMRDVLALDRAKTKMLPISKLGLMEMTRQREYESLQDAVYEACKYCDGRGLVKSSITISVELQRRLQELLRRERGTTSIRVIVHPAVLERLKSEDADILEAMEKEFGGDLTFRANREIHQEEFQLVNTATGKRM